MDNRNALNFKTFEDFSHAKIPLEAGTAHQVSVTIDSQNVGVLVLRGETLDDPNGEVYFFTYQDRVKTITLPKKPEGKEGYCYLFTLLKPKRAPGSPTRYDCWFGIGASTLKGSAPVGMLRFPAQSEFGAVYQEIVPLNLPIPSLVAKNLPVDYVSPSLSDLKKSTAQEFYIINGEIQESAQILMVDLLGNSVNIFWGREANHQHAVKTINQDYGWNNFICLVTAAASSPNNTEGTYEFEVGDPRRDASITVSKTLN